MTRKRRHKKRTYYGISMINLIDVIFMLLIFFMITTTFKKTENFPINLPKSSANFIQDENVSVTVFYGLENTILVSFDDRKSLSFSLDEFQDEVLNLGLESYQKVHLSADESLDYGNVISLLSILKENNVSKVNLDIEKIHK
ncbi:MAG: biopolymer transporter ExbD [Campylobacteraceae bacterium]|nr:biopolymer transporter ExbD [Campylobacteraceae bacterium]